MPKLRIQRAWLLIRAGLLVTDCVLLGAVSGCGDHGQEPPAAAIGPEVPSGDRDHASALPREFVDIAGVVHHPFDDPQARIVVLVFLVPDCPIANSYAPELNRLQADYESHGVRLFLVQVDKDLSLESAREHARQYRLQAPVVLDTRHEWVQKLGATVTPEVAVLSPAGELLYRGRIDDRYVALGKRRAQVTAHDLRRALDAILDGRKVAEPQTFAVGCPIPNRTIGE